MGEGWGVVKIKIGGRKGVAKPGRVGGRSVCRLVDGGCAGINGKNHLWRR